MYVNRTHKDFDIGKELLCLLPTEPYAARMVDIAADLAIDKQTEVLTIIKQLRADGYDIRTGNSEEIDESNRGHRYRQASLSRLTAMRAKAVASEYYDTVYGDA